MSRGNSHPEHARRGGRIAVIGAGPIGLEAAITAAELGMPVDVFERGRIAGNVMRWGHVELFTPFSMNAGPHGRTAVAATNSAQSMPGDQDLLTGRDFVDRYLMPLAQSPSLRDRIHTEHRVVSIGRTGLLKSKGVANGRRAGHTFRLLVENAAGHEQVFEADVVIDASGTYGNANHFGHGGVPAVGERATADVISYELDDILGADRARYDERRTILIGAGYSAATSIVALHKLIERNSAAEVVWLTRGRGPNPIHEIPNDRLDARHALARRANDIARAGHPRMTHWGGVTIEQVQRRADGGVVVTIAAEDGERRTLDADRILANVGYRPDRSVYSELHVHECYATFAPIKLAAGLLGETSKDCLDRRASPVEALINPEPGFFIVGAKSYGLDSTFLMRTGMQQVESVFSLLTKRDAYTALERRKEPSRDREGAGKTRRNRR